MGFADLLAIVDATARGRLGQSVTYTPGTGTAVVVNGVFDLVYVRADLGTPGVSTSGPAVFLTLSELPSNPYTDDEATVTVGSTVYKPHEVHHDGLGGTLLLLHLV